MLVSSIPLTEVEAWELMSLEFELACEGKNHASGIDGHEPSATAEYLLVCVCGQSWLKCAGWVEWARQLTSLRCTRNRRSVPITEFRFLPLPVGGSHE